MFGYEIEYQMDSTNVKVDILPWLPISENISHHLHPLDLNGIKEVQNTENVKDNGKKNIEINDVIVIKKKCLYKIVVPISLQLSLLKKTYIQFGLPGIYKMINLNTP